ncbi:toll/interleukin-1 receptor domain-containing protein [Rhizobium leguminosarum]|uniref:toll/interleukin-1 receptor domain-containing protein n=1 Tax=Rhizobium leguminosarum TaxID=384 RepID=UPI0013BB3901|nr:toll/interleukin-1 receptor domain-containing protein [Rhizobium leguminosarum]MBY5319177.1 toll/interleukin-1 receptor domain-containing protein [Rhizobium leguminosarum]MBY5380595.1 toll/interleukin-1 receptor domain-containing protein [Rhizobium leguminosarum]NEH69505.1 TIR domain-containing protein [Rhizobium leguminosarum]
MIFLSHNWKDKVVVEQFAVALASAFGQENVFYDSWSIQPGEGIIGKMNEGLGSADLFLFFVSANSLSSKMVDLEWQNGLMKASAGKMRLVPIKIDTALIPPILMQSVYLDLYTQGLEVTLRQVMDLAKGQNTFSRQFNKFSNLIAEVQVRLSETEVTISAIHFMEPRAHFLFLTSREEKDFNLVPAATGLASQGFNAGIKLDNGTVVNAMYYGVASALVPKFPMKFTLSGKDGVDAGFRGVMHQKSETEWAAIPVK